MSVAEPIQQKGIDGADLAKRWLESTTWIELPFDAYHNAPICQLTRLDGKKKLYDLFGCIYGSPKTPLYIESKGYDSVGGKQAKEYWEFLANAYSITAQDLKDGLDARREFWWITRMPFSSTDWADLTTAERMKTALEAHHPEALADNEINVDTLAIAAARVEVFVVNRRQEDFMLTPQELALVESTLNRKGMR
ncbi:hypothetical protein [Actinoplanes sp. NBRC 103695]|uniref:hypothetical protein n=1 Tax=Actinoplanes sp. NBRC 103695 TaxID=3032202 RepID=UPI0025528BFC|nr:hypothetical protein [Actinoplanes sp. NBRC 103695]